jgi:hypothetical protein
MYEPHDVAAEKAPRKSQATLLVEAAEGAGVELFHTAEHEAYATVPVNRHLEHWPVRTKTFRRWLERHYYATYNVAPGHQAVQDALGVLEGKALYESPTHPVHVRIAEHDGTIWLDLANDAWQAIGVTAHGWRVCDDPPSTVSAHTRHGGAAGANARWHPRHPVGVS